MKNFLSQMASSVKEATKKTSQAVTDALEHEDTQATINWAKKTATTTADEAVRLGKEVARSDLAKDAAAGAAIGAVIAVPIPVIGPVVGAVVGAGLGVYKNIIKSDSKHPEITKLKNSPDETSASSPDLYDQLLKIDELRNKGILTDAEFEAQKAKILGKS